MLRKGIGLFLEVNLITNLSNMEKFRKLGISEQIIKVIQEEKFETPSEIQEKSIPHVLEGKDVIARASTGSGKTLAFGSVIFKDVKKDFGIQALILYGN